MLSILLMAAWCSADPSIFPPSDFRQTGGTVVNPVTITPRTPGVLPFTVNYTGPGNTFSMLLNVTSTQ